MRAFTTTELTRLQDTQESAMQDTCVIQAYSSMTDDYGNPKPVYQDIYESECGLEHLDPAEVQATGEVPIIDAKLRLPLDTELDERDRIKITHRFRAELVIPRVFEIIGPAERGPSGLTFSLRIVDNE
jgi:hypothetical protein